MANPNSSKCQFRTYVVRMDFDGKYFPSRLIYGIFWFFFIAILNNCCFQNDIKRFDFAVQWFIRLIFCFKFLSRSRVKNREKNNEMLILVRNFPYERLNSNEKQQISDLFNYRNAQIGGISGLVLVLWLDRRWLMAYFQSCSMHFSISVQELFYGLWQVLMMDHAWFKIFICFNQNFSEEGVDNGYWFIVSVLSNLGHIAKITAIMAYIGSNTMGLCCIRCIKI